MVHGELGPHQEGSIEVGEASDFQQGGDTPYGIYLLLGGQGFLILPSIIVVDSQTDQLQGQDTVWHRPLDVIGAGGCVVISGQKVAHLDAEGGEHSGDGSAHQPEDEELQHDAEQGVVELGSKVIISD